MSDKNFTTSFKVEQTANEVFAAINNVRGWWSEEIEGETDKLGAEFKYHFRDIHRCTIKITGFNLNKKVVWHVIDNYFSFTEDKTEWIDTDIIFEITEENGKTLVKFIHQGLVPEDECYKACFDGWMTYINGSLKSLIETGEGKPNSMEQAQTETEVDLINSQKK